MTLPANEIRPAYLDRPAHLVMTFDPADENSMKFRIEALKDGKPTRVITNDDKTTVVVDLATKEYMDLGNTIDPILRKSSQHFHGGSWSKRAAAMKMNIPRSLSQSRSILRRPRWDAVRCCANRTKDEPDFDGRRSSRRSQSGSSTVDSYGHHNCDCPNRLDAETLDGDYEQGRWNARWTATDNHPVFQSESECAN